MRRGVWSPPVSGAFFVSCAGLWFQAVFLPYDFVVAAGALDSEPIGRGQIRARFHIEFMGGGVALASDLCLCAPAPVV